MLAIPLPVQIPVQDNKLRLPPLPPRLQALSPGFKYRLASQQRILDTLTAEIDRQAAYRRTFRVTRDVVDVGPRPEANDAEWIAQEKAKHEKVATALRLHADTPIERAAVDRFDRHFNKVATEFRDRNIAHLHQEMIREQERLKLEQRNTIVEARRARPNIPPIGTTPTLVSNAA